jgi:hypothetical protein
MYKSMVDKKIACILHYNIHKKLKIKFFIKLKPNIVMEHLHIYGGLWCVENANKNL